MASVIKLKRSSTPGAVPAGSDLQVGEVAVNLADRVIFAKQAGGAVVRIGESALANTNARINLLNTNLTGTNTALRGLISTNASDITAVGGRVDLVNTNLTGTNTAIRALVTAADARIDVAHSNIQATNTAIRALNTATQSALDTQEAKQASDLANTNAYIGTVDSARNANLANTNSRLDALESGSSGTLAARVDLVNTNLTGTNTAIRSLVTAADARIDLLNTNLTGTNTAVRSLISTNASDITAVGGRVDLVNTNLTGTNTAIRSLVSAEAARIDLVNTNLTASNTALRALIADKADTTALNTQIAAERAALANTNAFIKSQLANTNTRINNLNTSLSGDFMTKANPESNGHHAHTGRMSVSTNLLVSGNTHIDGNLTVEGEVTYISTTTLEVMDPLIKLASNNQTDVVDTGFYALYDEGSTAKYAGIFRDASDGIFKVFSGLQSDPTVTVDTTGTGYALAQLDANIDGGSF